MPTYDYECTACSHTFEHFQSMSDEPLKKCPKCGKRVHRLIGGGTGVIFKGSGFYVNDSRKASSTAKTGASKTTSEGGNTESKTEKPAETKPAETKPAATKETGKKESA